MGLATGNDCVQLASLKPSFWAGLSTIHVLAHASGHLERFCHGETVKRRIRPHRVSEWKAQKRNAGFDRSWGAGQVDDAARMHTSWMAAWTAFGGLPELFDISITQLHPVQRVSTVNRTQFCIEDAALLTGTCLLPALARLPSQGA